MKSFVQNNAFIASGHVNNVINKLIPQEGYNLQEKEINAVVWIYK